MKRIPSPHRLQAQRWRAQMGSLLLVLTVALANWLPALAASQIDLVGPPAVVVLVAGY